jgi:membrane protease YdiL (CAAX protease family)
MTTLATAPERSQSGWLSLHAFLLLAAVLGGARSWPPLQSWPWFWLAPLAVYAVVVLAIGPLRRSFPRLKAGCVDARGIAVGVVLCLATSGVLLGYQWLMHPDVSELAAHLPGSLLGSVALAWACFSLLNAALEELVFRGVLYEALLPGWGAPATVAITAVLFGLGHLHGYPPGPVGAVLAGLYGVALGLIRCWTGGLALAVACHVFADATIFGILVYTGAFVG